MTAETMKKRPRSRGEEVEGSEWRTKKNNNTGKRYNSRSVVGRRRAAGPQQCCVCVRVCVCVLCVCDAALAADSDFGFLVYCHIHMSRSFWLCCCVVVLAWGVVFSLFVRD